MNIYVLPRGKADEFKNLCESIRLRPNITDRFTRHKPLALAVG